MIEKGQKAKVKGLAIEAGMSRNKIKYTDEELMGGSETLEGVTILKDHNATTDNSIGLVERQSYSEKKQLYEGWVEEDGTNLVQKIRDKRLKVSVGAMVKKLVREKEDDDFLVAKGIHYMELSTTPTPGIPTASIDTESGTSNVVECFDMKQLQSSLTENEINNIIESCAILNESDNEGRGDNMNEEEKLAAEKAAAEKAAVEKLAAEKAAVEKAAAEKVAVEKAAAEKIAAEKAAVEKAEAEKAATEKAAADKLVIEKAATEKLVAEKDILAKEVQAQKDKIAEMEKVIGATKGKVDNGNTTENVEVTDNYAVETSRSGKLSIFMMPNPDGSFPINRGD